MTDCVGDGDRIEASTEVLELVSLFMFDGAIEMSEKMTLADGDPISLSLSLS